MFSESAPSFQKTLVYQTLLNIILWTLSPFDTTEKAKQKMLRIPALFDTQVVYDRNCHLTRKNRASWMQFHHFWRTHISTNYMLPTENPLPPEVRPVLYRINCDCAPLFEKDFGTCHAYEKPWGYVGNKVITLHHPSLASNTIGSSHCFNNPAFTTQTPSASVF